GENEDKRYPANVGTPTPTCQSEYPSDPSARCLPTAVIASGVPGSTCAMPSEVALWWAGTRLTMDTVRYGALGFTKCFGDGLLQCHRLPFFPSCGEGLLAKSIARHCHCSPIGHAGGSAERQPNT